MPGCSAWSSLGLTLQVARARGRSKVRLGTGGDRMLERAVRAHANFSEFVPLALVLLALAEGLGAGRLGAAPAGAAAAGAARIAHAIGISREPDIAALRGLGAGLTLLVVLLAGLALLALAAPRILG